MTTWIADASGNRANVEFWESEDAARRSLATLKDCSGCSDCYSCSDCSYKKGKTLGLKAADVEIPTIPNIDQAIYAAASRAGALDMGNWHTCETTHCRAGWVVHLAGAPGKDLEERFNTELAAMLIYRESGSPISPCRFYG